MVLNGGVCIGSKWFGSEATRRASQAFYKAMYADVYANTSAYAQHQALHMSPYYVVQVYKLRVRPGGQHLTVKDCRVCQIGD